MCKTEVSCPAVQALQSYLPLSIGMHCTIVIPRWTILVRQIVTKETAIATPAFSALIMKRELVPNYSKLCSGVSTEPEAELKILNFFRTG